MARGRRPLPWIKLWYEMLGDPKMTRLSIAETGCWCKILLLAGQSPIRGSLMLTETEPMTIRDISKALNLTNREIFNLKSCVSKMEKMNSLRWNGSGALEVVHFLERQDKYPSDLQNYHRGGSSKLRINSELTPDFLRKEGEGRGEKREADIPLEKEKERKKKEKKTLEQKPEPEVLGIFDEMREFLSSFVCGGSSPAPPVKPDAMEKVNKGREPEPDLVTSAGTDPIPNYGKEGKAIKRMLARGFTSEQIVDCWKNKVTDRGGKFLSMVWVNEDIADIVKGGGSYEEKRRGSRVGGGGPGEVGGEHGDWKAIPGNELEAGDED